MLYYLATGDVIVIDNIEYVASVYYDVTSREHFVTIGFHRSIDRVLKFNSLDEASQTRSGLLSYLADYHQRKDIK